MSLRVIRSSCHHDGKASGRLALEPAGFRGEIVCDCGEVLTVLGHEEYELAVPLTTPKVEHTVLFGR
jgi:hypothetical protein